MNSLKTPSGVVLKFSLQQQSYRLAGGKNSEIIVDGNRFLELLKIRNLTQATVRAYGYDLVNFIRWLNQNHWKKEDLGHIDFYRFICLLSERELSPHSINRIINTCVSFYFYLFDKKPKWKGVCWENENNCDSRPERRSYHPRGQRLKIKAPKKLIEPLSPLQVNQFFQDITRYRDLAIVSLMLFNGLRSCEILNLTLQQINYFDRSLVVAGKGRKERTLPLSVEVIQSIERYCRVERPKESESSHLFLVSQGVRRGFPMANAGLRSLFRYRRNISGVHQANAHRFRHTFGTDLARSGVKLPVLQKIMGHADFTTTLKYIHFSVHDIQEEYQQAIQKIQSRYDQHSF